MDLFALSAKLTLDSTGFENGLRSAENSAKRSSGIIGRFTSGITGLAKNGLPKLGSIGLKTFGGITKVADLSVSVLRRIATTATLATGALAAMGSAAIPMIKKSISAYADFEQLEGGMKKLFGDAYHLVVQNADKAYKTAGISANEYMQLTTTFAAKLVNDLGGNTELAAQFADQAIVDMADNVNTFGTSMEDVQNAYRGFARGNFTMLDNLSLGYAGTKEGMEQLLARAEELSGVHYDIENFSDIIAAIHVIQKDMGVASTTMEEASNTISGSINMVKASWADLLTDMANPDKDLKKSTQKFTESVKAMIAKLKPAILQAMTGLSSVITELAPFIAQELPSLLEEMLPAIFDIGIGIGSALFKAIFTILKPSSIAKTVKNIGKKVRARLTDLLGLSQDASLSDIAQGIAEKLRNGFQNVGGEAKTLLADLLGLDPEDASWGKIGQEIFRAITSGLNFGNEFLKRLFIGNDIFDSMTKDLKGQEPSWEAVIQKWAGTLKKEFSKFTLFGDGENSLISLGLDIAGGLTELISQAIGGLANFLTAPETQNAAQEFLSGIALDLSKILSKLVENVPELLSSLSGTLAGLITNDKTKAAVTGLLSSASRAIVDILGDKTIWSNLLQSAIELIKMLGSALYSALTEGVTGKKDGGLLDAMLYIVNNIGTALWESLKSVKFGNSTIDELFTDWRTKLEDALRLIGFVGKDGNWQTPPFIKQLASILGIWDKDKDTFKNLEDVVDGGELVKTIQTFMQWITGPDFAQIMQSIQPLLKFAGALDGEGALKVPDWVISILNALNAWDEKEQKMKVPDWLQSFMDFEKALTDLPKNLLEGLGWIQTGDGTFFEMIIQPVVNSLATITDIVSLIFGSVVQLVQYVATILPILVNPSRWKELGGLTEGFISDFSGLFSGKGREILEDLGILPKGSSSGAGSPSGAGSSSGTDTRQHGESPQERAARKTAEAFEGASTWLKLFGYTTQYGEGQLNPETGKYETPVTVTKGDTVVNVTVANSTDVEEILGAVIAALNAEDLEVPGHNAKGLWEVPYDDYLTRLHRDEMVLTASQARDYRDGNNDTGILAQAISELRNDMQNLEIIVGEKTFGRTVVQYGGRRMNNFIGGAEDRISAGYGW